MAVCLNKSWKVPVGYFFIDGLSGQERANLVKLCIKRLHDVGVDVIALVCDWLSCHFAMLRALGPNLTPPQLHPHFKHPLDKTKIVYVFLDVSHMLKLIRNTLGDHRIFVDGDGQKICWEYITELQKLQDDECLRLGNKLKEAHIKWWQQKMKVNLPAQTLSSSVANAIQQSPILSYREVIY